MKLWCKEIGDPIRGLTLERLSTQIESFVAGHLANFSLSAESMEQRDDVLKNVISKRKKAVARHGWEILTIEDSPEAERHRVTLEAFYNNLTCTSAVRVDERGGVPLLIFQMMDSLAKGYAVHEITWRPIIQSSSPGLSRQNSSLPNRSRSGQAPVDLLTAELRFIPLWFFENTTGKLRFLNTPGTLRGIEMREREWLVTVSEALMIACSRAFLFKHFPLQAWLDYSLKYGTPGLRGVTPALRDSPEWNEMARVLETFMSELAVVTNNSENIEVIDLKGSGNAPFADLVERMDRVMIALWRGADLSTLSRNQGYGASLQTQESKILEMDDAELITSTLNSTLDTWVIKHIFGEHRSPLAYIRILVTPQEATAQDLAIDQFLISQGAKLSLTKTLQRYGRAPASPDEKLLGTTESITAPGAEKRRRLPFKKGARKENPESAHYYSNQKRKKERQMKTWTSKANTKNGKNTISLANSFTLTQTELIQLSPFGRFEHTKGYQKVDPESASAMVNNFNSFLSRLGRRFAGVPFYVGHPDVPEWQNYYSDKRAYGWVTELIAKEDGLYGKVKWSKAGQEILENAHFKFLSPFWEAAKISEENGRGVYRPSRLISVGLTNEPNLPVLPLANNSDQSLELDNLRLVGESTALFKENETSNAMNTTVMNENTANSNTNTLDRDSAQVSRTASAPLTNAPEVDSARVLRQEFSNSLQKLESTVRTLEQKLSTLVNSQDTIDEHLRSMVVDGAIANSKISPSQRQFWLNELKADFHNARIQLLNSKPMLKNETLQNDFSKKGQPSSTEDRTFIWNQVYKIVHDRMEAKNIPYQTAWAQIREEYPEYHEIMRTDLKTQKNTQNS
jgi:hypothetical protein